MQSSPKSNNGLSERDLLTNFIILAINNIVTIENAGLIGRINLQIHSDVIDTLFDYMGIGVAGDQRSRARFYSALVMCRTADDVEMFIDNPDDAAETLLKTSDKAAVVGYFGRA